MNARDYRPPRHLWPLPSDEWFWREFGAWWTMARAAWRKQAQLVRACEAQNWRCCYCGRRADTKVGTFPQLEDATREHVTPRSQRGGDGDDNIVMACMACNSARGSECAWTFAARRRAA